MFVCSSLMLVSGRLIYGWRLDMYIYIHKYISHVIPPYPSLPCSTHTHKKIRRKSLRYPPDSSFSPCSLVPDLHKKRTYIAPAKRLYSRKKTILSLPTIDFWKATWHAIVSGRLLYCTSWSIPWVKPESDKLQQSQWGYLNRLMWEQHVEKHWRQTNKNRGSMLLFMIYPPGN